MNPKPQECCPNCQKLIREGDFTQTHFECCMPGCSCHTPAGEAIKENLRHMNNGPVFSPQPESWEERWHTDFERFLITPTSKKVIKSFIRTEIAKAVAARDREVIEKVEGMYKKVNHSSDEIWVESYNDALSALKSFLSNPNHPLG